MERTTLRRTEKFQVPDKSFDSFYLPSTHTVFKLLKLPHNLPLILQSAEYYYGVDSGLSRNLKNKMVNGGINSKHRDSFISFVEKIGYKPKNEEVLGSILSRSYTVRSNAGAWLSALDGFMQIPCNEFGLPLIQFLQDRADIDLAFLESSKKNGIGQKGKVVQAKYMADFVSKNTWVDNETIQKYVLTQSKINNSNDFSSIDKSDCLNILKFNFSFEADFYLSSVAIYDSAIHQYFSGMSMPTFNKITRKYSEEKIVSNLFEGLLDTLRERQYSQGGGVLSWEGLSRFIDTSDPHNLLNKWRKGKELPNSAKFSLFLDNLDFLERDEEAFITQQYMKVAIALDALLIQWESKGRKVIEEVRLLNIEITQDELGGLLRDNIASIEKYYKEFDDSLN